MIKVQNDLTKDRTDPLGIVLNDEQVKTALLDLDIVVGNHCHPDYVFAMANGLIQPKPNTIAFERIDGPQVKNKRLLKDENLLRLVKMYKYQDNAVNNLSSVDGRIFTRFLSEDIEEVRIRLSDDELSKVVNGTSFLHYKRHDNCERLALKRDFTKPTKYDVFFAGSTKSYAQDPTHKSGQLVSKHRKDCIKALRGLKNVSMLVADDRVYGGSEYLENIASAKITVSPWGWGESCYRDYEGILLHTDVIKPRGYKILSYPDIYTDTVFYCNPDWSNLQEVVDKCLSTWDERKEVRAEASKRLIEWRQPKAIAGILANIIKEAK